MIHFFLSCNDKACLFFPCSAHLSFVLCIEKYLTDAKETRYIKKTSNEIIAVQSEPFFLASENSSC